LILLSDKLIKINADNGHCLFRILMVTHMVSPTLSNTRMSALLVLTASLMAMPCAWAYKVEKICEDIPATSSAPAQKKCKVVRVQEGGAAKGAAADGKGDAKKDAKPAGGH
jgi:hypothetical protein